MKVELMKEVKRRILAEPRAVTMDTFYDRIVTKSYCGSVGCIAGHAILASGIKPKAIDNFGLNLHETGRTLLGISESEAQALFYFHNDVGSVAAGDKSEEQCPYYVFSKRLKKQRAGSQRYAKIVADAIDHAIFRYNEGINLRD